MARNPEIRSPDDAQGQVSTATVVLIAASAAALSVGAAALAASSPFDARYGGVAVLAHVLVIAAPVLAGLYAITRRRATRFGWLLVVAGFAWAPTALAESGNSVLYTLGRIDVWVVELMLIYLVLAFPSGRLETRTARALFWAGVALFALFYLPTVPFVDGYPVPNPWTGCGSGCPGNAFMLLGSEPGVIHDVIAPLRDGLYVFLLLAVGGVLVHRVMRGSLLVRRTLSPVLAFAIARIALAAVFIVARRVDPGSDGTAAIGVMVLLATPALAIGFFAGLVRWRAFAFSSVRRLTTTFVGPSSGARVRDLLAVAFEDPTLEIIYWAPDPGRWVDAAGMPYVLPSDGSSRAVTEVADGGRRIAALVHDAALADQPIVSEVAGGFALVALENQRLEAELRASLHDLRESRARILSAADEERHRIERDLHDGAQQQLVALGIKLQLALEHAESDPNDGSELLREIGTDIDDALAQVRSLAHGVYPPLLADRGLAAAIRHAANGGPPHTTVRAEGLGRYPQATETAVYFCCLEALQNAAKHAQGASEVSIVLSEQDGALTFQVRDDGPGMNGSGSGGAGLANMEDRMAAIGGSLTLQSMAGGGTQVSGRAPLGGAELTPELEGLLRSATDALDDCFAIFRAVRDRSGAVVDFAVEHMNEAACRDLGASREQGTGRTLGELLPGYATSEAFEWHKRLLGATEPMAREDLSFIGPREDAGHLKRAYDMRGAALVADRLVVSWRDITSRKRAELELRLQSLVLDKAAEGVSLIRASDAVIVYANPRYAAIFGYAPGELEGRPVSVLNWEDTPGDAQRLARQIAGMLEDEGEASFEVHNRRKDGSSIWTEAHVATFEHPEHGRVWVTVQQDLTDREQAAPQTNGDRRRRFTRLRRERLTQP